ncbi:MAG: heme ABC exporter ATP-binding protein CcmA [Hyphomicrobiaceae bacterium]|nr:heme ABC exporter ATP-binding protein CcmA [Hyphomicrobiaceae bacterium]
MQCKRGERTVLAGLDLFAGSGTFVAIRGPNGAGKSTFLMAVAGLLPFSGEVSIALADWDYDEHPLHEQMLFVTHLNAIKPELTVRENLGFWADMVDGSRDRIGDALNAAGIGQLADVPAGAMSKGQQRRCSLARLLIADKPIWLLDEPTSALDKSGDKWIAGLISDQVRRGGLVLAATHRPIVPDDDINIFNLDLEPV